MKREFRDVPGFVLQPCPLVFSNPTPGIVINRPNGSDVYEGVLKDYTGEVRPRRCRSHDDLPSSAHF